LILIRPLYAQTDLNLGRIKVINRSIESVPTSENLFVIPTTQNFKVSYKLQDTKSSEPFNTRATAELKIQYTFGKAGEAEDWYVDWSKSKEETSWNPLDTYKIEDTFKGTITLSRSELLQRCAVVLKGESGRSSDTQSQGFTLVLEPNLGGDLLIHALIVNESAKTGYQIFNDLLQEYADGHAAQKILLETMEKLEHNAKLFIEHYDIYSDPQGNWADIVMLAIEAIAAYLNIPLIGTAWMLVEYTTIAIDLINSVTQGVIEANNASLFGQGMKQARDYLVSCASDPVAAAVSAKSTIRTFGYDQSMTDGEAARHIENSIQQLIAYKTDLAEARKRFVAKVESWIDFALSRRQQVLDTGNGLFDQIENDLVMHAISLECLRRTIAPVLFPDLVITSVSHSPGNLFVGGTLTFDCEIKNNGNGRAEHVNVVVKDQNWRWGKSVSLDTLHAGDTRSAIIELPVETSHFQKDNPHIFMATVDATNQIPESNETNNDASQAISVTVFQPRPDLTLTHASCTPERPLVGDTLMFSCEVKNIGNRDASDVRVLVADQQRWGSQPVIASLTSGASHAITVKLVVSPTALRNNPHHFNIHVDPTDRITELDETNNQMTLSPISILSPQPDLTIVSIVPLPRSPGDRDTLRFNCSIKNIGNADARNVAVIIESGRNQGRQIIRFLSAGDLKTVPLVLSGSSPSIPGSKMTIKVTVDPQNTIPESNETNNERTLSGAQLDPAKIQKLDPKKIIKKSNV